VVEYVCKLGHHNECLVVLIKDIKGWYPNNPLWGDSWGWALFKSDARDKQIGLNYEKDCLGCQIPAKADDWIYVKGYVSFSIRGKAKENTHIDTPDGGACHR
jgi:Cytochrome P460